MNTLYTIGYRAKGAMEQVETLVQQGAIVLDIRMMPRSRYFPQWNRTSLETRFGFQYDHLELLGNVNYRTPKGPIHLQNGTEGLLWLWVYLQRRPVVLLCGCPRPEACHRSHVCRLVRQEYPLVPIVHLVWTGNGWDRQHEQGGADAIA